MSDRRAYAPERLGASAGSPGSAALGDGFRSGNISGVCATELRGRLLASRLDLTSTRRQLIVGTAALIACAPLIARAQSAGKVFRVGFLVNTTKAQAIPFLKPLLEELQRLGYVEGRNIEFHYAGAEGRSERYAVAAAELIERKVDVIFSPGSLPAKAARQAHASIPIVVVASDLVEVGLVKSLARPGGNITGIDAGNTGLVVKQLELLKRIAPALSSAATLGWTGLPTCSRDVAAAQQAARKLGLSFGSYLIDRPADIESAFSTMAQNGVEGVAISGHPIFLPHLSQLADLGFRHRIAAAFYYTAGAEAGGLFAYDPDFIKLMERAAVYIDKILKGAAPGDLPVEFVTHFKLTLNLKTAKALGITVPPAVIALADRVIE